MSSNTEHVGMEIPHFISEDKVIKSTLEPAHFPDDYNIGKAILEALDRDPNHIAQIDGESGETTSFAEMKDRSQRCALWMEQRDLKPDDVVLVFSDNRMDTYVPVLATFIAQSIFSACSNNVDLDTARHVLRLHAPKLIFASEDVVDLLTEAASTLENNRIEIIVLGEHPPHLTLSDILNEFPIAAHHEFRIRKSRDDTALIVPTSGSTGTPKSVVYTNGAFLQNLPTTTNRSTDEVRGIRALWLTRIHRLGAISMTMVCILRRATRIVLAAERDDVATICRVVERRKVNSIFTMPYLLNCLVKSPIAEAHDLTSLRVISTGGLKISEKTFALVKTKFPTAKAQQGYGMTEMGFGRFVSTPSYDQTSSDSVGFVTAGMQLKVIDEGGNALGPRIHGEICVKSSSLMSGYYKNDEATKKVIDADGWLHTGDLGYYAENGEIFVLGRATDTIQHPDGRRIFLYEIENVLLTHPSVIEAVVVSATSRQVPVAFVQTLPDQKVTENELVELSSKLLGDSMRLNAAFQLTECCEPTASDKLPRYRLKLYADEMLSRREQ